MGRLQLESQQIMIQFQELVSSTIKSFQKRCVPLIKLFCHVMTLGPIGPVFKKSQMALLCHRFKELVAADTIPKFFLVLEDYFSFFNYHIIEHIIKELGAKEDKTKLQKYKKAFNQYAKRRIFESLPEFGSVIDANHADIFVVLDSQYENCTVAQIKMFQHKLREILCVSFHGILHLCRVVKYAPKKDSADKLQLGIDTSGEYAFCQCYMFTCPILKVIKHYKTTMLYTGAALLNYGFI